MLLPDHLLLLDKIVNKCNRFSLTKLNDNSIKQLIPIKKRLIKILSPFIFKQSTKKGQKKQTIGFLAIDHRKMAQIYTFFSKTVYVPTRLKKILQYLKQKIEIDIIKLEINGFFYNKTFKNNLFLKKQ